MESISVYHIISFIDLQWYQYRGIVYTPPVIGVDGIYCKIKGMKQME